MLAFDTPDTEVAEGIFKDERRIAKAIFFSSDRALDPSNLGHHERYTGGTTGGAVGIMYTTKLGFLDLGHLRDMVDLTKYVYDRLRNGCPSDITRRAPGTAGMCTFATGTRIKTTHGYADITGDIDEKNLVPVAQSIAYDDSVGYEIGTWWIHEFGGQHSSFSPEDLPSNYLGTWVAAEAIRRIEARGTDSTDETAFNNEVDAVLIALCKAADAQPAARTKEVFTSQVSGRWVEQVENNLELGFDEYLQRRNFTGDYWDPITYGCLVADAVPVGSPSGVPTAPNVGNSRRLEQYRSKYNFTFDTSYHEPGWPHHGPFTRAADYDRKINDVRKEAEEKYGAKYDSPDPPFRERPGKILSPPRGSMGMGDSPNDPTDDGDSRYASNDPSDKGVPASVGGHSSVEGGDSPPGPAT